MTVEASLTSLHMGKFIPTCSAVWCYFSSFFMFVFGLGMLCMLLSDMGSWNWFELDVLGIILLLSGGASFLGLSVYSFWWARFNVHTLEAIKNHGDVMVFDIMNKKFCDYRLAEQFFIVDTTQSLKEINVWFSWYIHVPVLNREEAMSKSRLSLMKKLWPRTRKTNWVAINNNGVFDYEEIDKLQRSLNAMFPSEACLKSRMDP